MELDQGIFIVVEGIDGTGKTTVIQGLKAWLEGLGLTVVATAEPTTDELGQILRRYLQEEDNPSALDALVFAADRVHHCHHLILPHLAENHVVISDRFVDSSIAYQTVQFDSDNPDDIRQWIADVNRWATDPDLVILLDADPEISVDRLSRIPEKFERVEFLKRVRQEFLTLATSDDQNRHRIVNAENAPEVVLENCKKNIVPLLGLELEGAE